MTDDQTSQPVTVTPEAGPTGTGSIDDLKLFHSRGAPERRGTLLDRQGLLDPLAPNIEEGNAFLHESARTCAGDFKAGTPVLTKGLTSGAFLAWLDTAFAGDESALLAAHPEHYVMGTESIGRGGEHRPPVASFSRATGERMH
ncbi:hypothetical protein [Streptomyces fructofermentans]|uniref:hypothetical protein n=1 Tax=Streptomyces fructofermentans TaxID=152141 RepID=UPI0037A8A124